MNLVFQASRATRQQPLRVSVCAAFAWGCASACAQSNVTVYGVLDAGLTHVSNTTPGNKNTVATGILSPNLLGFAGREDLGDGLAAIFRLQHQFELDTGTTDGNFFGHTAYVGLSDIKLGSLTAGTQMDFMFRSLTLKRYGPVFPFISLQNTSQGPFKKLGVPNLPGGSFDFDRTAAALKVPNSVLYESPNLDGLNFGALYGFGEGGGATRSAGIDYAFGPVQLDAAYTDVKYPQFGAGDKGITNWGFGGRVAVAQGFANALYTNTKNTQTGATIDVYEAGFMVPVGTLFLVTGYQWMKGNAQLDNQKAQQLNLGLYQKLSPRTTVYVNAIAQRASGTGARAWIIGTGGESSTANQSLFRLGIQHGF